MPDQPLWKEFGEPLSKGTESSDEVFNKRYGTYQDLKLPEQPGKPVSSKFDPQPFSDVK